MKDFQEHQTKHLVTFNKLLKKAVWLFGIFLEIHLIMSTSIQTLKGIFLPPSSPRTGMKRIEISWVLCSSLCYTTKLLFFLTWSTCIISQGLLHTVLGMALLNYFALAKYLYFKKISNSTNHIMTTHTKKDFSPAIIFCWFRSCRMQYCTTEQHSCCRSTYLSIQRHSGLLGFGWTYNFSAPLQIRPRN